MKSEMGDRVRLLHIFEAIKEIEQATTGKNYDDFYNDHVLRIAVVKWLEKLARPQITFHEGLRSTLRRCPGKK